MHLKTISVLFIMFVMPSVLFADWKQFNLDYAAAKMQ